MPGAARNENANGTVKMARRVSMSESIIASSATPSSLTGGPEKTAGHLLFDIGQTFFDGRVRILSSGPEPIHRARVHRAGHRVLAVRRVTPGAGRPRSPE